jgi:hypothetical protein
MPLNLCLGIAAWPQLKCTHTLLLLRLKKPTHKHIQKQKNTQQMTSLNTQSTKIKVQIELISWLITALITGITVMPLLGQFKDNQFLASNILFIIIFVTYFRHILLLKYTFLAHLQKVKVLLIFLSIPIIFLLVETFMVFQDFLDNDGLISFYDYFRKDITEPEVGRTLNYMRREYLFFAIGSIICVIVLPFRLLISYWRVYNKTGNV